MAKLDTAYFVFDIESVADGALVSRMKYPGETLSPAAAIAKYREELLKENGKDFIPYTYQLPISLVIAKVARDFRLLELVALGLQAQAGCPVTFSCTTPTVDSHVYQVVVEYSEEAVGRKALAMAQSVAASHRQGPCLLFGPCQR